MILFDALGVRDAAARTASVEMKASFLKGTTTTGPITFPVLKGKAGAVIGPARNVVWVGTINASGNGVSDFVIETQDNFGAVVLNIHSFLMLDNQPSKLPPGGAAGYMEEGVTQNPVNLDPAFAIQTVSKALNDTASAAVGFSTGNNLVVGAYANASNTPTAIEFAIKGAKPTGFSLQAYDFKAGAWEYLAGAPSKFGIPGWVAVTTSFVNQSIKFPLNGGTSRFVGANKVVLIRVVPVRLAGQIGKPNPTTVPLSIKAFRLKP